MLRTLEEKLSPEHSALIIVDMQNDFCSPGGFVDKIGADLSPVAEVVQTIRHLLDTARTGGVSVVHVRSFFDPKYLNEPMRERLDRLGVEPYCVSGTWGVEFLAELTPEPGEYVVTKHRYSGFYGTNLDVILQGIGVRTAVVCGTATNNCVDGTARDAFYNGYYVILPNDASCAPSVPLHQHAVATALHAYTVPCVSEDVVAAWKGD